MPTLRNIKRYGWRPDLPDQRDRYFNVAMSQLTGLPDSVDLRDKCPAVYDQGQLGSCTANAIAAAVQFERARQQLADYTPSRLFIYYNERAIEDTIDYDSGATLRDGIKVVAAQGVCPETMWPYDIMKFADAPPQDCYASAALDRAVRYSRVINDLLHMKVCLALGFPFVFGFTVYRSFESPEVAQTGVVPMPVAGEEVLGGHAVMAVGYDNAKHTITVRNSWGDQWGDKGYCYFPQQYLVSSSLASDFWTIRMVTP